MFERNCGPHQGTKYLLSLLRHVSFHQCRVCLIRFYQKLKKPAWFLAYQMAFKLDKSSWLQNFLNQFDWCLCILNTIFLFLCPQPKHLVILKRQLNLWCQWIHFLFWKSRSIPSNWQCQHLKHGIVFEVKFIAGLSPDDVCLKVLL